MKIEEKEIIDGSILLMDLLKRYKFSDNLIIKICMYAICICCERQKDPEKAFSNLSQCLDKIKLFHNQSEKI